MYILAIILSLVFSLLSITNAQFTPSAVPLLVRSPYLNAWASFKTGDARPNNWPNFWTGDHVLGWSGLLRVDDDNVYEWMGAALLTAALGAGKKTRAPAVMKNLIVTPTRTIYQLTAGPVDLNVTFLNPIEPDDLVAQSFPFSYIFVDAVSNDNAQHRVQVYQDLSGEWLSFKSDVRMQWETTTDTILTHSAQLATPDKLQEPNNMTLDGTLYYATNPGPNVKWQTGPHADLRSYFLAQGNLNNTKDPTFRNINDNFPVLSFMHDLGTISGTPSASIVYAVGMARDPVIRQNTASGPVELPPYWNTKYKSVDEGLQAFLADASNARDRAVKLDNKIQSAAQKISSNYNDLVTLATRQTFAGVETALGSANRIYMFMKDTGSSSRISPVETIYAAFPAYLYINSAWGRYLLEPLLEYESSALYSSNFAASDLGPQYPLAPGQPNPLSARAIEDTSSMLIMLWTHARFSGDVGLVNAHYSTLIKWTDQLISLNAVNPTNGAQSADGLSSNGLSNLAIKAIIAVRAMAEISHTLGKGNDASKYQKQASDWVKTWKSSAFQNGHLASLYSAPNSWALMYNLYPDKLLGMNLVGSEIYDAQDKFYTTQALSGNKFGLPYDSGATTVVKSHWTIFTVASAKDGGARDYFLQTLHDKATDVSMGVAFPSTYNSQDGSILSGRASPVQGAMFSLLTLNMASKLEGLSGNTGGAGGGSKTNVGAIAGGVVAGVAVIALILGALFFVRRRRNQKAQEFNENGGNLNTFFGPNQSTPGQQPYVTPLSAYQSEHLTTPYTSSPSQSLPYQSQPSVQSPQSPPQGAMFDQSRSSRSYTSGSAEQSGSQHRMLAPLRLHNADEDHQAPTLPRKQNLALRYEGTPSQEDIARHNAAQGITSQGAPSVAASSEASQLRNEVDHLRREMEEMRSRTMYEPPPQYQ